MTVTAIQGNQFTTWNNSGEDYIAKMQHLAAEIQQLLGDLNQEKTKVSERDKKDYKQLNSTAASYHTSIGRANLGSAITELLTMGALASMQIKEPALQAAGAKIVGAIISTWPAEYQRAQAVANSDAQLLFAKIQNASSQQQNETIQQAILTALNKLLETLGAATR